MATNRNGGRHLKDYRGDLYHRHYCRECNARVYPYDSLESMTVAPELGASKREILLYSFNNYKRDKNPEEISRVAWCWAQSRWVQTYRESRFDTQLRYLKRQGVQFKFPNGRIEAEPPENAFVKALDARLIERRPLVMRKR